MGISGHPRWGWLGQLGLGGALSALIQLQLQKAKLYGSGCPDGWVCLGVTGDSLSHQILLYAVVCGMGRSSTQRAGVN